jgi:DNA-binding CsgD family transcriptional regulator
VARIERFLRQHPESELTAPVLLLLVRAHLDRADPRSAAAAAARLADLAAGRPATLAAALADHAVGLVTEDPGALEHALAGYARWGLPLDEARVRLDLAGVLAGDRPEVARTEARTALARFQELSATRDADAAMSLLRRLGVRGHSGPRGDGKLTAREHEVLGLLGEGLSNGDIAARLFLSRRTAEHHVSNILAKLGLGSRAEAVAYAVRRPVERAE